MNLPLAATERVWAVGSLCHAAADALDARFNPVAVRGEISGYSRAPSGHCYFTLKDAQGQLRCAMFRRAAGLLDFVPRDGELVEVRGVWAFTSPVVICNWWWRLCGARGRGLCLSSFCNLRHALRRRAGLHLSASGSCRPCRAPLAS